MATGTKAKANGTENAPGTIVIPTVQRRHIEVTIRGLTPLITNRFSEAKLQAMEAKQQGVAANRKPPRDPKQEFTDACYRTKDGQYAIPASGIKKAMVSAGQRFADEKGTELKGAFSIPAELLPLKAPEPEMRRDLVRLAGVSRTPSIAYRPEFFPWETVVPIVFNAAFISLDQVVNLLSLAGFGVGVCDWRVERNGIFGQFEVIDTREIVHERRANDN